MFDLARARLERGFKLTMGQTDRLAQKTGEYTGENHEDHPLAPEVLKAAYKRLNAAKVEELAKGN